MLNVKKGTVYKYIIHYNNPVHVIGSIKTLCFIIPVKEDNFGITVHVYYNCNHKEH